ncbi:hypothetical protein BDB00DRAFT_924278 [Zychaea mexicana]|uniref:uncharacterized protein n=1 Tax=Zychaea mexicana TaxID=64656 RepID=UPI0022FDB705|nr:uncharacterized protein BDB00DRAFT_924278 [Zychaea mexicana]KAI9499604.1 hypothetical protein BDB00DRAFT_924278 [Zychaea mexicana]
MNENLVTAIATYSQILEEAMTPRVATWKPFFIERCTQWCMYIETELLALSDQECDEHRQAAETQCDNARVPELPELLDAEHQLNSRLIKNIYLSNEMYWTVISTYEFLALASSSRQETLIQDVAQNAHEAATIDVLDIMISTLRG